jgi:hypothetical protein
MESETKSLNTLKVDLNIEINREVLSKKGGIIIAKYMPELWYLFYLVLS